MSLFTTNQSFSKKLTIFLISFLITTIVITMIITVIVIILNIPFIANLPEVVSAAISFIGIILIIAVGILSFKKLFGYLKKEFRNV